ncbi:hypothetical protein DIPPA_30868 [Diplonema papillatum]|nr:hypothetical protein DIPPA_30868 [Diplonema papillatum]
MSRRPSVAQAQSAARTGQSVARVYKSNDPRVQQAQRYAYSQGASPQRPPPPASYRPPPPSPQRTRPPPPSSRRTQSPPRGSPRRSGPPPSRRQASDYSTPPRQRRPSTRSQPPQPVNSYKRTPSRSRRPQGTYKSSPKRGPPQGTAKSSVAKPIVQKLPSYDASDRGPEDRIGKMCTDPLNDRPAQFDIYDPLIRGVVIMEGVNYARYETAKDQPNRVAMFLDAIKADLISEVGNGVRLQDIVIKIYPGKIKTVVLHYDTRTAASARPDVAPALVDADWCMKVEYFIRSRDVQRQSNVAVALYTAFATDTFAGSKSRSMYCKIIDPSADMNAIVFSRPKIESPSRDQRALQLQSPPREGFAYSPQAAQGASTPMPLQPHMHQQQQQQHQQQHQQMHLQQHHQQQQQQQQSHGTPQQPVHCLPYSSRSSGTQQPLCQPLCQPLSQPYRSSSLTPPPGQSLYASPQAPSENMSPEQLEEKDRQLECLANEIERERRALRQLQVCQPNQLSTPLAPRKQVSSALQSQNRRPMTFQPHGSSHAPPLPAYPHSNQSISQISMPGVVHEF